MMACEKVSCFCEQTVEILPIVRNGMQLLRTLIRKKRKKHAE
ncbi:hypothetical protein BSM4216_2882 [Bacillus smithii]|nr:hypothetical protein BSM4216_2882 [Bacillus smithii]